MSDKLVELKLFAYSFVHVSRHKAAAPIKTKNILEINTHPSFWTGGLNPSSPPHLCGVKHKPLLHKSSWKLTYSSREISRLIARTRGKTHPFSTRFGFMSFRR